MRRVGGESQGRKRQTLGTSGRRGTPGESRGELWRGCPALALRYAGPPRAFSHLSLASSPPATSCATLWAPSCGFSSAAGEGHGGGHQQERGGFPIPEGFVGCSWREEWNSGFIAHRDIPGMSCLL